MSHSQQSILHLVHSPHERRLERLDTTVFNQFNAFDEPSRMMLSISLTHLVLERTQPLIAAERGIEHCVDDLYVVSAAQLSRCAWKKRY